MKNPTWRQINKEKLSLLKPCENMWQSYLKHYEDFDGDIAEFLMLDKITAEDKIWVAVGVMPKLLVEVFAVDCAFAAAVYDYSAYAAYAQERENQVDALLMIIEGEV